MITKREQYIDALLNKRWNGKVKIITGIRRCGKSFLLLAGIGEDDGKSMRSFFCSKIDG